MKELIQEVLRQITGEPLIFTVELVQFILLVLIIRFLLPDSGDRSEREAQTHCR